MNMNETPPDPTQAFALFGRVMASIAMIEQIMRLALGRLEQEKLGQSDAGDRRIERFKSRLLRLDFGQLLQLTVDKFKLQKHWLGTLKDAKSIRDNFAHGFWVQHVGYLRSDEGLNLIIRSCDGAARHMELVSHDLLNELNVDLGDYLDYVEKQAHAPEVLAKWDELLAAHEAALHEDEKDRGIVRP